MNNRLRLYIEVTLVVCIIILLIFLVRKKEAVPDESGELAKILLQKLEDQRSSYELKIIQLKAGAESLQHDIDSLKNLKQGVKIVYVDRIKRIDNLTVSEQAKEFKILFDKNGIK